MSLNNLFNSNHLFMYDEDSLTSKLSSIFNKNVTLPASDGTSSGSRKNIGNREDMNSKRSVSHTSDDIDILI